MLPEGEEPIPRLWPGFFTCRWSVPPQCEYLSRWLLRHGFSNIKSGLNRDWVIHSRVEKRGWSRLSTRALTPAEQSLGSVFGLVRTCTAARDSHPQGTLGARIGRNC